MSRNATCLALAGVFLSVLACSNELSDYSHKMNPILQAHSDEFAKLYNDTDSVSDRLSAASSNTYGRRETTNELMNIAAVLQESLEQYERKSVELLEQWILLKVPKDAIRFHELTFEMMQLRYDGVVLWRNQTILYNPSDVDFWFSEKADEKFARAERLLIQILAEARELED